MKVISFIEVFLFPGAIAEIFCCRPGAAPVESNGYKVVSKLKWRVSTLLISNYTRSFAVVKAAFVNLFIAHKLFVVWVDFSEKDSGGIVKIGKVGGGIYGILCKMWE